MSGTPNRRRSGGGSSGCSLETFNTLIVDMKGTVYLGGAQELVDVIHLQNEIKNIDVIISDNDPLASERAHAVDVYGRASRLRTESNNLIGLRNNNRNSYTGVPEINAAIDGLGEFNTQLYNACVAVCNSRVVDSDLVTTQRNLRGHKAGQITAKRRAWYSREPGVCDNIVAEVKDLSLFNCENADYLNAHGSKAKRATVCLYAIGTIYVLVSHGDSFVSKDVVTDLMEVGNEGPAFKDAVKILKHSGVIFDDNRARFWLTKTWLDKVNVQFKFNHATPECTQDPKFRAWIAKLNQAISRDPDPEGVAVDPNPKGVADDSETDADENI